MIRITIRLNAQPIGDITISNDGTGTPEIGNYDVVCQDNRGHIVHARVEDYERLKRDAIDLTIEALTAVKEQEQGVRHDQRRGEAANP